MAEIEHELAARIAQRQADLKTGNAGMGTLLQDQEEDLLELARQLAEPSPGDPTPPDPEPIDPPDPAPAEGIEGAPFEDGGFYEWLPDVYDLEELGAPAWLRDLAGGNGLDVHSSSLTSLGPERMVISGGWKSSEWFDLPAEASHRRDRAVSAQTSWGDPGPLWYQRAYEVRGRVDDVLVWRVGDFIKGREGHVAYHNVRGDLVIDTLVGIQHGAQLVQLCWREGETKSDPSEWPEKNARTIVLRRLASIDGGIIDKRPGVPLSAVRASWPVTIFAPGHDEILVEEPFIRTNTPEPHLHSTLGLCRSHGFLLCAPSQRPSFTKHLAVTDADVELVAPDRSVVRIVSFGEAELASGRMSVLGHDGEPMPSKVSVVDGDRFEISQDFQWSGEVSVHHPSSPYHNPVARFDHVAGERLVIEPRRLAGVSG